MILPNVKEKQVKNFTQKNTFFRLKQPVLNPKKVKKASILIRKKSIKKLQKFPKLVPGTAQKKGDFIEEKQPIFPKKHPVFTPKKRHYFSIKQHTTLP